MANVNNVVNLFTNYTTPTAGQKVNIGSTKLEDIVTAGRINTLEGDFIKYSNIYASNLIHEHYADIARPNVSAIGTVITPSGNSVWNTGSSTTYGNTIEFVAPNTYLGNNSATGRVQVGCPIVPAFAYNTTNFINNAFCVGYTIKAAYSGNAAWKNSGNLAQRVKTALSVGTITIATKGVYLINFTVSIACATVGVIRRCLSFVTVNETTPYNIGYCTIFGSTPATEVYTFLTTGVVCIPTASRTLTAVLEVNFTSGTYNILDPTTDSWTFSATRIA